MRRAIEWLLYVIVFLFGLWCGAFIWGAAQAAEPPTCLTNELTWQADGSSPQLHRGLEHLPTVNYSVVGTFLNVNRDLEGTDKTELWSVEIPRSADAVTVCEDGSVGFGGGTLVAFGGKHKPTTTTTTEPTTTTTEQETTTTSWADTTTTAPDTTSSTSTTTTTIPSTTTTEDMVTTTSETSSTTTSAPPVSSTTPSTIGTTPSTTTPLELPFTGSDPVWLLWIGVGLLAAGLVGSRLASRRS